MRIERVRFVSHGFSSFGFIFFLTGLTGYMMEVIDFSMIYFAIVTSLAIVMVLRILGETRMDLKKKLHEFFS